MAIHNGYVICYRKKGDRYKKVKLHRLIMETHLGRSLSIHERVIHLDGNRLNNNLSNLALMSSEQHATLIHAGARGRGYNRRIMKRPPQIVGSEEV